MIFADDESGTVTIKGSLPQIITDASRILDTLADRMSKDPDLEITYKEASKLLAKSQKKAKKVRKSHEENPYRVFKKNKGQK